MSLFGLLRASSRPKPPLSRWQAHLASRGLLLVWSAAAGALLAATAPWHTLVEPVTPSVYWFLGLFTHWQWAYLALALFGGGLALFLRQWSAIFALALVIGSWFLQLPAAPTAAPSAGQATAGLTLATLNLNRDNQNLQPLLSWLDSPQAPDVLVLQEFTPEHQQVLLSEAGERLRARYTHRHLHPQTDPFGMAVLSRWPTEQFEAITPADEMDTLQLQLRILWNEQPMALTALHPMPPLNAAYTKIRDARLHEAAQRLAQQTIPGVLVGDLNDTPWGAGMRAIAPYMQRASGLAPTWPNAFGGISLLPLDHVLVTSGWAVRSSTVGAFMGSDHRPVVAELVWAP